ncbi:MAG: glycosyltransferase [Prevotella sp.]|nr:glycosyltransferase [Prevotella sp.]
MRILFSITSLGAGGLERYVLRFLTCNPDLNVDILCKSGKGGDLETEYLKRLTPSNIIKHKIGYFNPIDYYWLIRFIVTNKYDIICDFTGNFAGLPMLCSKWAGVKKRIAFYRSSRNHFSAVFYKKLFAYFLKRLTYKYSTNILSNSKAALEYFYPGITSEKFRVIYNGIDLNSISQKDKYEIRESLGIPSNAFVIGHTGRVDSAKNHQTIFKVANILCKKYDNLYFLIIGKGVPAEAQRYKLDTKIIVYDYRDDIMDVLPSLDLYYFPSLWEGQPNALIEAMVTGIPFVASDIDAIRESVPPTMVNKLVPPSSVETAVQVIEDIYLKRISTDNYKCTEWAKSRYNSIDRFSEFNYYLA